jgi:hypothetical protein
MSKGVSVTAALARNGLWRPRRFAHLRFLISDFKLKSNALTAALRAVKIFDFKFEIESRRHSLIALAIAELSCERVSLG